MRLILTLICIFSVTSFSKAQIFSKKWSAGSYYDTLGHKTTGLIAWSRPDRVGRDTGDYVFYKIDKTAEKVKLPTRGIAGFTMGADSFVVSRNTSLYYAPVIKVVLNNETKIYYWESSVVTWGQTLGGFGAIGGAIAAVASTKHIAGIAGFAGGSMAYFFGSNPNELNLLTRKNFIETMSKVLADKPEVVREIISKKMRYGDMDDILEYYKTGKMPVKQPVYDSY